MPTYEYRCAACGHRFEAFQSIIAAPLTECPACGANEAGRIISRGAGFLLKGGGFYQTDYKPTSGGEGGGKSTPAPAAAPADGAAAPSTESPKPVAPKPAD